MQSSATQFFLSPSAHSGDQPGPLTLPSIVPKIPNVAFQYSPFLTPWLACFFPNSLLSAASYHPFFLSKIIKSKFTFFIGHAQMRKTCHHFLLPSLNTASQQLSTGSRKSLREGPSSNKPGLRVFGSHAVKWFIVWSDEKQCSETRENFSLRGMPPQSENNLRAIRS